MLKACSLCRIFMIILNNKYSVWSFWFPALIFLQFIKKYDDILISSNRDVTWCMRVCIKDLLWSVVGVLCPRASVRLYLLFHSNFVPDPQSWASKVSQKLHACPALLAFLLVMLKRKKQSWLFLWIRYITNYKKCHRLNYLCVCLQ